MWTGHVVKCSKARLFSSSYQTHYIINATIIFHEQKNPWNQKVPLSMQSHKQYQAEAHAKNKMITFLLRSNSYIKCPISKEKHVHTYTRLHLHSYTFPHFHNCTQEENLIFKWKDVCLKTIYIWHLCHK